MSTHHCEEWQMQDSAKGGHYCAACGAPEPCRESIEEAATAEYVDEPLIAAQNAGMDQLVWREPTEEEDLNMFEMGGVRLWLDAERMVIALDVPPGYTLGRVGR